MTSSYRTCLAILFLAATASVLGAPLAHADSPMHLSGKRSTIHPQERFRLANGHHQAPPQQVADPFADMILG
ncbi:hypothetical protein [Bradyrhizobium ganzhouense]|uniref:hypothetical protein n=1 Tax=Bradyrhizobium ganzhouense TaxID=1179767 RepID=UPI003CF52E7D